jgi:hypothetical protein
MSPVMRVVVVSVCLWPAVAFAGGSIFVNAVDFDGKANVIIAYERWNEATGAYEHLRARHAKFGKDRLRVAPGRYKLKVTYQGTVPHQVQESTDIEIQNGGVANEHFYFEKGVIEMSARDNDRVADCWVFFELWDETAQAYMPLRSGTTKIGRKRLTRAVAPGKYRVVARYGETVPLIERGMAIMEVVDGHKYICKFEFHYGPDPDAPAPVPPFTSPDDARAVSQVEGPVGREVETYPLAKGVPVIAVE